MTGNRQSCQTTWRGQTTLIYSIYNCGQKLLSQLQGQIKKKFYNTDTRMKSEMATPVSSTAAEMPLGNFCLEKFNAPFQVIKTYYYVLSVISL